MVNTQEGVNKFNQKLQISYNKINELRSQYTNLRALTSMEHENNALLLYGGFGDPNKNGIIEYTELYYIPDSNYTNWITNYANNQSGVNYAKQCRALIK